MGVTVVVSTPYMDEVARADRACFMFEGSMLSEGTPDDLTKLFKGSVYYADVDPTAQLVERINRLDRISARRFGSGLHLYFDEKQEPISYQKELNTAGLDYNVLKRIEPDLEDCFIQLMGADNG